MILDCLTWAALYCVFAWLSLLAYIDVPAFDAESDLEIGAWAVFVVVFWPVALAIALSLVFLEKVGRAVKARRT